MHTSKTNVHAGKYREVQPGYILTVETTPSCYVVHVPLVRASFEACLKNHSFLRCTKCMYSLIAISLYEWQMLYYYRTHYSNSCGGTIFASLLSILLHPTLLVVCLGTSLINEEPTVIFAVSIARISKSNSLNILNIEFLGLVNLRLQGSHIVHGGILLLIHEIADTTIKAWAKSTFNVFQPSYSEMQTNFLNPFGYATPSRPTQFAPFSLWSLGSPGSTLVSARTVQRTITSACVPRRNIHWLTVRIVPAF